MRTLIARLYGEDNASVNDLLSALETDLASDGMLELTEDKEDLQGLEQAANAAPVVRFVNLVLYEAVQAKARTSILSRSKKNSKSATGWTARYEMSPPPKRLALPVVSRIKVMSNLNIAERRLPQDGRLQLPMLGRQIDFRVSTLPTQFGESVVLRILDRSTVSLELENLGMPPDTLRHLQPGHPEAQRHC